ncbi:hypothetical protein [Maledivibacter halophilus]|uniref:Uncharacterized protein n=1 Tax=Maledivibacter halophilus TaxID=36842 RepID=A0A1T5LPA0_9FIRM|nr:hypothetical protein [Maledivibacter halophilus]SKC77817.1 hypothetical protein SAMN02194393_03188 [Maledivibacter halophilus]
MENDYVEIIGKVFDIIDEAESKIVSKDSEERFNEEGYLLQKIHEDLIRLVGKAEKRYVEYQTNTY